MAASIIDGPFFRYGNLSRILQNMFSSEAVGDSNPDSGPDGVFQGTGFLDCRYWFQKDRVQGSKGIVPAFLGQPYYRSVAQIPAALSASNIAGAANVTSGTAMTLAAASLGVTKNVPYVQFSNVVNGGTVATAAIALDFGFGFGNVTSGSTTITVADATLYKVGMPLVIGGVGNSGGTVPLLTYITAITAATPSITVADKPLATNTTAPIGTGNLWYPSGTIATPQIMEPTAHAPMLAAGPSFLLDPRQAIARGIRITGVSGGSGGTFTVLGADIYGQSMSETITVGSGASTGYSNKTYKYILSVTPNFTDAHNYSVGTTDLFGLAFYAQSWDDTAVCWASATMTSSTGFTAGDATNPATATTGDVRGTIQTGATGPGSGIGSNASNGSLSSLAMTGRKLTMDQMIPVWNAVSAFSDTSAYVFGQTQA